MAEPAGDIRMGLPSSISHILGVPLILAARKQHPKVSLTIAEAMSGYMLDWLRVGRVDLGLLYDLVEDRGLRAISLLSEGLVLFGSSSGNGRTDPPDNEPAPFTMLTDRPLILPSVGHGRRLDEKAAAAGLRLKPTIDIDAFGAIKTLVKLGLGYSVLPAHAVQKEVDEKELLAWPFDPPLVRTVHLVLPTDRPLSRAARAIARLCRTTLPTSFGPASGVPRRCG
jgi:LysR family transcriptional regulator, nitrogen assimilation regulatory protein